MYEYQAKLKRIIDGDTVELVVDLGFRNTHTTRFRLEGIDAVERGQEGYAEASDYLAAILARNTADDWDLLVTCHGTDKYGRWVATLYIADEKNQLVDVNQALLRECKYVKEYEK